MASITTFLISLTKDISASSFLQHLRSNGIDPLIVARPVEWMIAPAVADYLLTHNWDLLLVLDAASTVRLPSIVEGSLDAIYHVVVNTSSTLPEDFREKNRERLQSPSAPELSGKPLIALSGQRRHVTPSLLALANSDICPRGPVSMLNFVSYQPWPHAAESYKRYVEATKSGPLKRVGAHIKLIGSANRGVEKGEWDEVVLTQYPSLSHFLDMACDPEYQEGNYKYRLPVMRDLCILMTTEVDLDWTIEGSEKFMLEGHGKEVVIEPD